MRSKFHEPPGGRSSTTTGRSTVSGESTMRRCSSAPRSQRRLALGTLTNGDPPLSVMMRSLSVAPSRRFSAQASQVHLAVHGLR